MEKNNYYYAIGRRKTAVATLRLFPTAGETMINDKMLGDFIKNETARLQLLEALQLAEIDLQKVHFTAKVKGSGVSSQLGAIKLALARAVVLFKPDSKKSLKQEKLLTRDPRMVERKKPGLHKARKAEQYSKR